MTVGELKLILSGYDDDLVVVVDAYESGFTTPKLQTTRMIWRGPHDELPYVFGEWSEHAAWLDDDEDHVKALVLAR